MLLEMNNVYEQDCNFCFYRFMLEKEDGKWVETITAEKITRTSF